MRKTSIIAITIILLLAASLPIGCGTPARTPDLPPPETPGDGLPAGVPASVGGDGEDAVTDTPSSFLFKAGGVAISMGEPAAPVVDALGEPQSCFEAPSCAFDGIDRIYYYSGFELYTYPVNGEDFVLSVNLTDDSVTTFEGIYLGMSYDNMLAAYGDDYAQSGEQYTYTRGDSTLSFLIDGDAIVVITYDFTNTPV